MMANSIKKQILARLDALLQTLKTSAQVQGVERRRTVNSEPRKDREVAYIIGDEEVVGIDNLGYTIAFPLNVRCTWRTETNGYERACDLAAAVQTLVEGDMQIGGLCNAIRYEGEVDLTKADSWSQGVVVVAYLVEYRRRRGAPGTVY